MVMAFNDMRHFLPAAAGRQDCQQQPQEDKTIDNQTKVYRNNGRQQRGNHRSAKTAGVVWCKGTITAFIKTKALIIN
jgi:hypothetical protein